MTITVAGHGGGCCGARHLRSFSSNENDVPIAVTAATRLVPPGRLAEVILTQSQCRQLPHVLNHLAGLGYVLTDSWVNGNTQNRLYRFSRVDTRRPLDLPNWNGMVMTPGLEGGTVVPLTKLNENVPRNIEAFNAAIQAAARAAAPANPPPAPAPVPAPVPAVNANDRGRVGDLMRIVRGQSRRRGREFRVIRADNYYGHYVFEDLDGTFQIAFTSCDLISRATPHQRAQVEAEDWRVNNIILPVPTNQRHNNAEVLTRAVDPLPPAPPETMVFEGFANVYRGGRIGALYPTEAECRAARQNAGDVQRTRVFSTGRRELAVNPPAE